MNFKVDDLMVLIITTKDSYTDTSVSFSVKVIYTLRM